MRKRARTTRKSKAAYILLGLVVVTAIAVGVLSIVDIAGSTVARIAADTIHEKTGLRLSVREAHGNPVRGYRLDGVTLSSEKGETLFSARDLSAGLNFMSLFQGSPRLSALSVGGVDMDLDRFITEFSNISFPESEGGGEIPVDRISLRDSRFTSKWGHITVNEVAARLQGTLIDLNIAGAVNGVALKGTADADIQGQNISINHVEIAVGKGLLTSSGNIRPSADSEAGPALDFQGNLKGIDISEIAAFWSAFMNSEDYNGTADAAFSIESEGLKGEGGDVLISLAASWKGSKLGGYPVESIAADMKYSDMRITVDSLKATALSVPIEGSLAMALKNDGPPSVMIKLDGSNAPLAELAKLYPGLGKVGGQVGKFNANIQGPTNALSGTVEFSAPDIILMGKRITDAAVQIKLAKSDTATVSGKFFFEGAQGYVQGSVAQILSGASLNLTLKLLNLNVKKVEDLIPDGKQYGLSGNITTNLAVKGKATAPSVSGTLSSPQFTAMGYILDKPSITFAWDKDVLTLKESSGSWEGQPIKISGAVGPLSSKTPAVNVTAQLALKPETLKKFAPDIAAWKLQGTINAGVKIAGKMPSPKIDLLASSPSLSAFDVVNVKNLEVTTAVTGDLSKLEKIDVTLKAASLSASGVGLQDLNATVRKNGQQVRLENVSAKSGGGSVTGGGNVTLSTAKNADASLNLAFDVNKLDLAPLAKSGGAGVTLTGLLSGKISVTGPASNPSLSLTGQSPALTVQGLALTDLKADISGNLSALKINSLKVGVGGAPLSASGSVTLSDPFKADVNIEGTGLDLTALTADMPDMKGQVDGKIDLKFNVKSTGQGNSGTGSLRAPALTFFGIKAANINVPLTLSGNSLKSEGGTLDFYGGKVTNSLTFDISTMKFSDTVTADNFDVNALVQDATGGLGGKITGRGALSMKINGTAAKAGKDLTYSGSGQLTVGEGAVSGFTGFEVLQLYYGVNGIRYTKVTAPLRLETGRLTVSKGSAVTPPPNDPIYRSAKLVEDGAVTFDKKLYFVADINVSFQLINALAGGALGGIGALTQTGGGGLQNIFSGGSLKSALEGALSGGKEAGKEEDFRDVTIKITGTADKPSLAIVKTGAAQKQQGETPTTPQSPAENTAAPVAPSKPATPQEAIRDKIIDAIAPQKPQERQEQPQQETSPDAEQPQEKQQEQQPTREKVIEDAIKEGLDSLFRKK